jgi:hypothetical protein
MRIRVSAPGRQLKTQEVDRIEKDLEKIDRRLHQYRASMSHSNSITVGITSLPRPITPT